MDSDQGRSSELWRAARALAAGQLVAFPTETVYGLGARADDEAAVARIYRAKGRPPDHPVLVHVRDETAAAFFASHFPDVALRLMRAFWPGPVTVIVPRRDGVGLACSGGQDSIGLRCPAHPVAQSLLAMSLELGVPGVAAPSANRFGRISPTRADHVLQEFGAAFLVLDGGECREGIESAIVDCSRGVPVLLRPGTVERAALQAAAGQPLLEADDRAPRASGTLESHYAPAAKLRLIEPQDINRRLEQWGSGPRPSLALALYSSEPPARGQGRIAAWRPMPDNPMDVAHEMFAVLREFDALLQGLGGGEIWVAQPPADPPWEGVRDRLRRAAAG